MALEDLTGTNKFIDALVLSNPVGATDRKRTLDDHTRGIKNVLFNCFEFITGKITATHTEINSWEARIAAVEAESAATKAIVDDGEPIGTIIKTTTATDPTTYKPGIWTQIAKGRVLIGEGEGAGLTARVAGAEIGQEDAIIPVHSHTASQTAHRHSLSSSKDNSNAGSTPGSSSRSPNSTSYTNYVTPAVAVASATGGEAVTDKNIPPSFVVYIWERTA